MSKSFKKTLGVIGAIVFVAFVVLGSMQLWASEKYKPLNWVSASGEPSDSNGDNDNEQNGGENDGNDNELSEAKLTSDGLLTVIKENGVSPCAQALSLEEYATYSISDEAESAYVITVTVEPEDSYQRLVSGLAWQNKESEWAAGKAVTDYVTVTQLEDNPYQFALACNQAFGEPVHLIICSALDSSVGCTVRLDYAKRLISTDLGLKINGVYADNLYVGSYVPDAATVSHMNLYVTPNGGNDYPVNSNVNVLSYSSEFGVGTVEGTFSTKITLTPSDTMKEKLDFALHTRGSSGFSVKPSITINAENNEFIFEFYDFVYGGGSYTQMEKIMVDYFLDYANSFSDTSRGSDYCLFKSMVCEVTYTCGNYTRTFTTVTNPYVQVCKDGLSSSDIPTSVTPDKDSVMF